MPLPKRRVVIHESDPDAPGFVAPVAAEEAGVEPLPKPEQFFRIQRAAPPYGAYWIVEAITVSGNQVVDGPKPISDADVYALTEMKLLKRARAPEESK